VRRVAAVAATVVALAVLGWAAWAFVLPRSAVVPDVVGLPRGEARALLQADGLEVRIGAPEFSLDVPAGSVVSVDPPVGQRVERGTEVVLRLSQGPRQLEVPEVTGMPLAAARGALADAGFVRGEVTHEYHPTVPDGRVISQTPRAGRTADEGSAVALVVSKGPPPVTIPEDLTGRAFGDVRSILVGLGFEVVKQQDFSARVEAGHVLALRPRPGTTHPQGTTVTVVVSRGPRTFPMPDVIDLAQDQAVARLRAAGLEVRVVDLGLTGPNDGVVLESTPGPGATVEFGQTVRIRVG
jgi:serine/threonine-protein kinase